MSREKFLQVYITNTTPLLTEDEAFRAAMHQVPEERQRKASRFRFRKDQSLSLGAGLLLRHACKDLGYPGLDERVSCTVSGKPYFSDCPELFFSLSHSGSLAVCAAASCSVGCDVEKRTERGLTLAKRFFHPEELQRLLHAEELPLTDSFQTESWEPEEAFQIIWTLKESFLKCTGDGLSRPLNSFAVALTGAVNSSGWNMAALTFPESEASQYSLFQRSQEEYSFALCIQSSATMEVEQQSICLSSLLN